VYDALLEHREALAELLLRHWQAATFLAARVLGSQDLASDAVREAAIAVMTDLSRLRSPDRFGAWFCGIALNVSRRWLRQTSRSPPARQSRSTAGCSTSHAPTSTRPSCWQPAQLPRTSQPRHSCV